MCVGQPTSILSAQRQGGGYPRFEIPGTARALAGAIVPNGATLIAIATKRPGSRERDARRFFEKVLTAFSRRGTIGLEWSDPDLARSDRWFKPAVVSGARVALAGDPGQPRPIIVQNHGNAVQHRNIWLLPLFPWGIAGGEAPP